MKDVKGFQLALLGIFGFFIAVGVLAFAGILPGFDTESKDTFLGNVVIWGTLPQTALQGALESFNTANRDVITVSYIEKSRGTFDQELVEALAEGRGPDMILLPHELIVRHRNKIHPFPYEYFPERTFKDSFIEEGELYLTDSGVLGVPFIVDPLILYWNRDLFSSALISRPPSTWEEFFGLAPKLTTAEGPTIIRSFAALGEIDNVTNAKEILSALILQAGNPIMTSDHAGALKPVLTESFGSEIRPADEAFRFYTEFSNPSKTSYSWNRSLPYSRDLFARGDLALYLGFAGEYQSILKKNPHLNFDVAIIPQVKGAERRLTFGKMYGLAVLKGSANPSAGFSAAQMLSESAAASSFSQALELPPARRDLLAARPAAPHLAVFYDSALFARGWLDPSPQDTATIFREIVDDITSGRRKVSAAVEGGNVKFQNLMRTVGR